MPRTGDVKTLLRVRVQPKASRNALMRDDNGRVRIALTAPPVDGAANAALEKYVSGLLGLAKGRVTVDSGAKSREKTLKISGLRPDEVAARLGLPAMPEE